jgi:hypothetical protein
MASLSKGYTFGATEQVTNAKLHALVDSGAVTDIVTADIQDAQITDGKISSVSGSKFVTLANTPSGAGKFPIASLPFSADGGLGTSDTLVPTQKATKTYVDAFKPVGLNITSQARGDILYFDGTNWVRLAKGTEAQYLRIGANDPAWYDGVTQEYDTDSGTSIAGTEATFLSQAKSITSGRTVLLIASGEAMSSTGDGTAGIFTLNLKHGSTTVQTVTVTHDGYNKPAPWSLCAIVTGLSGSITFIVTGKNSVSYFATFKGNLAVLEF